MAKQNFMWSLLGKGGHKFKRRSWSHDKDGHHAHNMAKTFRTRSLMILKHGKDHLGVKVFKIYINDDPELTLIYFMLIYFMARSKGDLR